MSLLLLVLALSASAQDPVDRLLAPTPATLRASLARVEQLLSQGLALGTATARTQNAVLVDLGTTIACQPNRDQHALRAELLTEAWWARVQSARSELGRAEQMAASPAAQPLLREADATALERARQQVKEQSIAWLMAARAQQERIQPYRDRCPTSLQPGPGLRNRSPASAEEQRQGVAVLLMAGGLLCPDPFGGDAPVAVGEDAAVVLGSPAACWSAAECDCVPVAALPGAVFGPSPEVESR